MLKSNKLAVIGLVLLSATAWYCTPADLQTTKEKAMPKDPHSFAVSEEARITHLNLDIKVDFELKKVKGTAAYRIEKSKNADTIYFDTDELSISAVTNAQGVELPFELSKKFGHLGSKLSVRLSENDTSIIIHYETSPNAKALQWLNPEQTANKTHPFLFTQSQAILARTWIPIQDSPGIRFTYKAKVTVPAGLMAIMSAENPQQIHPDGIYEFEMKQAVPSYLMAMAVGNFEFEAIGPRTGIYAEPALMQASLYEFADMEKMVEAAELLYGPYAWGRFDMIVLPPSFPFGGMENPRVTFATPTIIAGDRSLTALVAHELAHSWSGNLVTNATWNDFWLNEGFTVYFERRIMEQLYGKDYAEMLAVIGYTDLQHTLSDMGADNEDTRLKLSLEGRDPDDGMTDIAYEKGYFLLRLLEETLGRPAFDDFLKTYFSKNAFSTKTTETFIDELKTHFKAQEAALATVGLEKWIYEAGLPTNCPKIQSKNFEVVEKEVSNFITSKQLNAANTKTWSSHEWLHFLRNLPSDLSHQDLILLDKQCNFTASNNSEILAAWFKHTIKNKYAPADDKLDSFLVNVGRRKFLVPLYQELNKANPEKAKDIYQKARPNYHSVSTATLDELLLSQNG